MGMKWVYMVPYGLILRESEATGVIKVLIYLKGTWYVILYLIIIWTWVGETFLEKTRKIYIHWRSVAGVKNLSWTRGSILNMVP